MHTVPLSLLAVYNSVELNMLEGIQFYALLFGALNLVFILIETSFLTCCENRGINLERKPQLKSGLRFLDTMSVAMLGCLFAAGAITLAQFVLEKQNCPLGFFEENIECMSCSIELDSRCLDC